MALDFLQSQRFAYADLSEQYGKLEELYSKKCVGASYKKRCTGQTFRYSLEHALKAFVYPFPQAMASVDCCTWRVCEESSSK